MKREYVPGARASTAASSLPRGREYYAHLVKSFTTLDVTPDEVYETGRREVARIRAEMEEVIRKTGFQGNFAAFLNTLRTDPRFYAKTPEELLKQAAYIAKTMDGKLPSLFGRLPRLPYGVEPVPAHLAPKYTGGRYVEAPVGGTRAGTYWVNTYALETRPLYTLESLTLHEAVPGHHLQIALQQELTGLPEFRRFASEGAFVEGWALYAERLGLEAGFYKDPYSDFGRLTYEMWRACRLVVDTGMHAKGWTRQEAMEYLEDNTALSLHEVQTETDRYISWPAQALCYKMGELKIRALRREAEEALGERFDVRGVPRRGPRERRGAAVGPGGAGARVDREVEEPVTDTIPRTAFRARNPATGATLDGEYYEASIGEIDAAARAADRAFEPFASLHPIRRAEFLRAIAQQILSLGDRLLDRAGAETGLPPARLESERARTVSQVLLFASLLEEGSWVEARIDRALPDRKPQPRPDLRRLLVPMGPVAVFGASNFPLAFSVAGGDTVSALAAGCPVVVKAHPAHPGTSELAALAIRTAARETRMPDGVFSMVHGAAPGDRHHARDASSHPGGRLHGIAPRRTDSLRRRGDAARADPGVCGDGILEPDLPPAGRARGARRRHRERPRGLRDAGFRPVLHEPGPRRAGRLAVVERVPAVRRRAARRLPGGHDGPRRDQGRLRRGHRAARAHRGGRDRRALGDARSLRRDAGPSGADGHGRRDVPRQPPPGRGDLRAGDARGALRLAVRDAAARALAATAT